MASIPRSFSGEAGLKVESLWSERIHSPNRPSMARRVPLSIIDSTQSNFSPAEMLLIFDPPSEGANTKAPTPDQLGESLRATLGAYPEWCGRSTISEYEPGTRDHLKRYGRCFLVYGGDDEPGVEFSIGRTDETVASLVPAGPDRVKSKVWDATNFSWKQLASDTTPSYRDLDNPSAPNVIVRVTTFSCGGITICLKISHTLADAHTMAYFARDWAAMTRAMMAGEALPEISPRFNPQALDRLAAGDIDAASADPELSRKARELPCHRFDWWISGEDCPYPTNAYKIPAALKDQPHDLPGTHLPWHTWDVKATARHCLIHFSGVEVANAQAACRALESRVSKQDAILAHVWNCINRARQLSDDDEPVYLNYTVGLRARTQPPLGDRFIGSAVVIGAVGCKGREAAAEDGHPEIAALIRRTVNAFTPEALAAHIHDKCYDQSPTRFWQAFSGSRHIPAASWIHTKIYDTDFGYGRPRYIEPVMPKIDGLVNLIESRPTIPLGQAQGRDWSADGIDAHVLLASDTMERMLQDPLLRRYA